MDGPEQPILPDHHMEIRAILSGCHIIEWRVAMQRRSTSIAATLRALERAIGARYLRRKRAQHRSWDFFALDDNAEELLVAKVYLGPARTVADLSKPLDVVLLDSRFVDLSVLQRKLHVTDERC